MAGAIDHELPRGDPGSWKMGLGLTRCLEMATGEAHPLDIWNDNKRRTHADVLALLDRVVQRMETESSTTS
jgi:hypothetical protein